MRKSGIDIVGHVPWGSHFCLFYEGKTDLLDTLVSYCKSGLENGEFCLWVVAEPVTIAEATEALREAVPDFVRYQRDASIEIVHAREWYLQDDAFDLTRVTAQWHEKLALASAKGYAGVRVTGDTAWLRKNDWKDFCEYEDGLNAAVADQHLAVLCTYPLASCGAVEILDVVRTHQFALARRHGSWDVIETAGLKQAKAEIKRLNDELERRVVERTRQLTLASEALRKTQAELAHVNRVAAIGQLAASISHEMNQPITAAVTNARAALHWLEAKPPVLDEVRQSLRRIVDNGNRAGEVSSRIRALIKQSPPQKAELAINEAIIEIIALTHGEMQKNDVALETRLAEGLPLIQGDRVQVQQVILNLVINAVEAMSCTSGIARHLTIATAKDESGGVLVTVRDTGPGLRSETFDRLFDAFYTTKAEGMGMGLSISRSIIDAHGGRIWASPTGNRGAMLQFTLPVG